MNNPPKSHEIAITDMTVNELVERYLVLKIAAKHNGKANYKFVRNLLVKQHFGHKRIEPVRLSDAKLLLIKLQREAITTEQKNKFLEFVRGDEHYCKYYDTFVLLFATGLRIFEFCGFTVKDLDFTNGRININKQIQRTRTMEDVIETTKTASGTR